MSAYLDRHKLGPDHAGGVSDPRLVRRLDLLPVTAKEITPEVKGAAITSLAAYAERKRLSTTTRATLRDMIFGDAA